MSCGGQKHEIARDRNGLNREVPGKKRGVTEEKAERRIRRRRGQRFPGGGHGIEREEVDGMWVW